MSKEDIYKHKKKVCKRMANEAAERMFSRQGNRENSAMLDCFTLEVIRKAQRKDAPETVREALKYAFSEGYRSALLENELYVVDDKPLSGYEDVAVVVDLRNGDE
jgi:hypothetical protein